jgi:predicted RNase H-like nuclease (RuvC/YqgF family)
VRYDAVNAMLLNEFLKEHRKVKEQDRKIQNQEQTIAQLKSTVSKQAAVNAEQGKGMEVLAVRLDQQESEIRKVNAQLEINKGASRIADNAK